MNDEDIKAIECSISIGKETGVWLTISPFVLEKLYNEYKKQQKELKIANNIRFKALKRVSELESENAQLRTELNNKDKMIEMYYELSKKLYAIEEDIKIAKKDIANGVEAGELILDVLFNIEMDLGGLDE